MLWLVVFFLGVFVYWNGPEWTELPEWTFICGFECLQCVLCAQNDLQEPQRVENASSMHFGYRKK